jgi:hypothetical protein
MTWLAANWQYILAGLVALDATLIKIFPKTTLFTKIQTWLSSVP